MKKYLILILCISFFSCKQQPSTPEEVERTLKTKMQEHLTNSSEAKIANAKYEVINVSYFPGKEFFECEFTVRMKTDTKDTAGIMKAKVSRDFSKVIRRS